MLLIAYGNPGRGDDGLGPAFAERLQERTLPNLKVVVDYQLTVEHALLLVDATRVVFVDAVIGSPEPYAFSEISPVPTGTVASHSLSPATVLSLAEMLYGVRLPAHVLGIGGFEFDRVHEGISPGALRNLDLAKNHFLDWVMQVPPEHRDRLHSTAEVRSSQARRSRQ